MVDVKALFTGKSSSSDDFDVEAILKTLTITEKIALLGGKDFWHTVDFPEKNVPSVRVSDGPNGVRGIQFFNGTPSNCLPCATGMASSFDLEFVNTVGQQLGEECRAKGAHVLLGPTINIQRSPLGGRGFESYSEDPYLSGKMAAEYVKGLQSKGVAGCLKHYVGNEQEYERFSADSIIPDRALREIYLEPFRIATEEADPKCYMSGYNKVNGLHVSESKQFLTDILREEWGWNGLVMSDWTGTYSSAESIKAGLDLEMPGPALFRGAQTLRDIQCGKLQVEDIDERARVVLNLAKFAKASGIPFGAPEKAIDDDNSRALLRKAAANAVVVLKNDKKALPVKSAKKIAVIGPNARVAVPSGGGSASMMSTYTISPLEAITTAAKEIGAEVDFSIGTASYRYLPSPLKNFSHPSGKNDKAAEMEYWVNTNEPSSDFTSDKGSIKISAKPDYATSTNNTSCLMIDGLPDNIAKGQPFYRYTTTFTPDTSGDWDFSIGSSGYSRLFLDGELLVDNTDNWTAGELFFHMASTEVVGRKKDLQKGKAYSLEVRNWYKEDSRGSPFRVAGAMRIGAMPVVDDAQALADAIKVAESADVTIAVIGLSDDFESEGFDRPHMELPGTTNKLIAALAAVTPNLIVVNQSGTPVEMPWVDSVDTLLQAFYGGNSVGEGISDVIFGKVNPSSKLPLSFPKKLSDSPSDIGFAKDSPSHLKTFYNENIYVGYRHFQKAKVEPLFPFGYGLSYSTFAFSDLSVSQPSAEGKFEATFTVKNTGNVAGGEVAQLYVHDKQSTLSRPVKELKGFAKVHLEPGAEQKVTISLDKNALKYWDDRRGSGSWVAEAGDFEILVGNSSVNTPLSQTVSLEKTFRWTGH